MRLAKASCRGHDNTEVSFWSRARGCERQETHPDARHKPDVLVCRAHEAVDVSASVPFLLLLHLSRDVREPLEGKRHGTREVALGELRDGLGEVVDASGEVWIIKEARLSVDSPLPW